MNSRTYKSNGITSSNLKGNMNKPPERKQNNLKQKTGPASQNRPAAGHNKNNTFNKKGGDGKNRIEGGKIDRGMEKGKGKESGGNNQKNAQQNMITMTEAEFKAILETIGHVTKEKEMMSRSKENLSGIPNANDNEYANQMNQPVNQTQTTPSSPVLTNQLAGIPKSHMTVAERKRFEMQQQQQQQQQNKKQLQESAVSSYPDKLMETNRSQVVSQSQDDSPRFHKQETSDAPIVNMLPLPNYFSPSSTLPPPHIDTPLSIGDKKRLQWQLERAEMARIEVLSPPWGGVKRGGGGDPITDPTGNVVTDYRGRRDQMLGQSNSIPAQFTAAQFGSTHSAYQTTPSSVNPPVNHTNTGSGLINYDNTALQPAAMRSVFALGSNTADAHMFTSAQERQKKEWLLELDKQREEDKRRKDFEKRRDQGLESSAWLDIHIPERMGPSVNQPSNINQPVRTMQILSSTNNNNNTVYANQNGPVLTAGGAMTGITAQDMNKRNKFIEHQEDLRRQMEEKELRKKIDKEREQAEDLRQAAKAYDAVELRDRTGAKIMMRKQVPLTREAVLAEDIRQAAKAYDAVELRDRTGAKIMMRKQAPLTREAVENDKLRTEALYSAIERARLEAERDKHLKLVEKLQKGNHDVTHLLNNDNGMIQGPLPAKQNLVTETKFGKGVGGVAAVGASQGVAGAYESRVLTPSQYRNSATPGGLTNTQEFGTQTDPRLASNISSLVKDLSHISTEEIEFNPASLHNKNHSTRSPTKVRIVSAGRGKSKNKNSPTRAGKPGVNKTENSNTINRQGNTDAGGKLEKPKWGYNNIGGKVAVKQSEKDFEYSNREDARLARQQELLDMMHAEEHRVPRSRGKSVGRDESPQRGKTRSPSIERGRGREGQFDDPHILTRESRRDGSMKRDKSLERGRNKSRSPPVTSTKYRTDASQTVRASNNNAASKTRESLYSNYDDGELPPGRGNFIPFIRSSNVLSPNRVETPSEGNSQENFDAERGKYGVGLQGRGEGQVSAMTADKQGKILQQLSEIRRALMEKQRDAMRSTTPSSSTLSEHHSNLSNHSNLQRNGHTGGQGAARPLSPIIDM